jgi:hypothetical protein
LFAGKRGPGEGDGLRGEDFRVAVCSGAVGGVLLLVSTMAGAGRDGRIQKPEIRKRTTEVEALVTLGEELIVRLLSPGLAGRGVFLCASS